MRILFDTNVLVAAFLTGGTCLEVVKDSIHGNELLITPFVRDELRSVSKGRFHFSDSAIQEIEQFLGRYFVEGRTAQEVESVCRDSKDDQILADALVNQIDWIITGDKDLLDLKRYRGIRIFSPRSYWELM